MEVYQSSYKLAMEIFHSTRNFPKDELYSLTSQMRNSSRSIPANIAEGWSKRRYENVFKKQLLDALGSSDETKVWLDFARDCKYISNDTYDNLTEQYERLGRKLFTLIETWKNFNNL